MKIIHEFFVKDRNVLSKRDNIAGATQRKTNCLQNEYHGVMNCKHCSFSVSLLNT